MSEIAENGAPWKLCEMCHVEPVEFGRLCNTCKGIRTTHRDGMMDEAAESASLKVCSKCGQAKPLDQFHNDVSSKDGKTKTCKPCKKMVDREANQRKMAKALAAKHAKESAAGVKAAIEHEKETVSVLSSWLNEQEKADHDQPKSLNALLSLLDRMHTDEAGTLVLKGNDYSGANRLANFERIGAELGIKPELVLWIYFKKHTDRLRTFITEGAVSSESVIGSIMDCRNYLALLRLMIEARQ